MTKTTTSRRLIAAAFSVFFVLALAGCDSAPPPDGTAPAAPQDSQPTG